eukprot:4101553-Amphidinium_carterae.1
MWKLYQWDGVRVLNHAKELLPEIFGHLQPSTVWRWKHSRDLHELKKAGRNPKIPPAAQTVLLDMARTLTIPCRHKQSNAEG